MSPTATPPPLPCMAYMSFAHFRHLIDAAHIVNLILHSLGAGHLTFQELFAGVFLEECLMCDRTMQVVNHELEYWLDLFFGIAGEMSKRGVLQAKVSETQG